MKKAIILTTILAACGVMAPQASAQRFALKAYDNLGLGKTMSVKDGLNDQRTKSSFNAFGLDFGWTFWRSGYSFLEANIGFGYQAAGCTFTVPDMDYHYNAPAYADEDGNEYIRYYELRDLKQTASVGYFSVPLYLSYQYKPLRWMGINAVAGFNFGFRCVGSVGKVSGTAKAWGVFPEYDDLLIDQDYLDDFGTRHLSAVGRGTPSMSNFNAQVMVGAGFEFYASEPVSFEIGVRYNYGLTNSFKGVHEIKQDGTFTAETAPVTYTVKDGTQVKSLTDYTKGGRIAPLSLHMGVNVRF